VSKRLDAPYRSGRMQQSCSGGVSTAVSCIGAMANRPRGRYPPRQPLVFKQLISFAIGAR
jgi:hypothetical protein